MPIQRSPARNPLRAPIAGLLTWLIPGAGHLYIGERVRGMIFIVTITLTFWTGVAIGGVKKTVDPEQRTAWFAGQICAGGHTLAALTWSRLMAEPPQADPSQRIGYGASEEVSVVYTGICGMLNILIIFDVLVRAERGSGGAAGGCPSTGHAGQEGGGMTDLLAFLITPVILGKTQQMLLLLPLCLAISVVYKTTKCDNLREIPVAALASFVSIVVGMYAVGVSLLLIYEWAA